MQAGRTIQILFEMFFCMYGISEFVVLDEAYKQVIWYNTSRLLFPERAAKVISARRAVRGLEPLIWKHTSKSCYAKTIQDLNFHGIAANDFSMRRFDGNDLTTDLFWESHEYTASLAEVTK